MQTGRGFPGGRPGKVWNDLRDPGHGPVEIKLQNVFLALGVAAAMNLFELCFSQGLKPSTF